MNNEETLKKIFREEQLHFLFGALRTYDLMSPRELYGDEQTLYNYLCIVKSIELLRGDINPKKFQEAYRVFLENKRSSSQDDKPQSEES